MTDETTSYDVEWHGTYDATDTLQAAESAWDDCRRPDSIASIFLVKDQMGMTWVVDLHEETTSEPTWRPSNGQIADLAAWMYEEQWDMDEIVEMIRRPRKYADLFSKMITDQAFDVVAKEPEVEDLDDETDDVTDETMAS